MRPTTHRTHRSRPGRLALTIALPLALLVGCGDDSDDVGPSSDPGQQGDASDDPGGVGPSDVGPSDVDWPGDGSPIETFDLGAGLVADLPATWGEWIEPLAEPDPSNIPSEVEEAGCTVLTGMVGTGAGAFDLLLAPGDCEVDNGTLINGYHGVYTSLDDVVDPARVEEVAVTAGTLVTFIQRYEEYTNEANTYNDHVGLLELEAPPDPDRPTLMVVNPKGSLPMDRLVLVAEAIRVG